MPQSIWKVKIHELNLHVVSNSRNFQKISTGVILAVLQVQGVRSSQTMNIPSGHLEQLLSKVVLIELSELSKT